MKRKLLLPMLLLMSLGTFAQITITQQHMPKAKDTFYYDLGTPTQFASLLSLTGPNKTWRIPMDSIGHSVVEYKNSSGTPYSFYFTNTVGLKIADSLGFGQFMMQDVYQFYAANSVSYRVKGLGFQISLVPLPLAGNYTDEDEMYFFPLTYGRLDTSEFNLKINIPLLGSYSQEGYRVTEVTGHGNLIMPHDTFEVLQVKSTIVSNDSLTVQTMKIGFPTTRIEYRWLSTKVRAPLLEITGTEVAGNFVPAQARYMHFNERIVSEDTTGHGTANSDVTGKKEVIVYPNPFGENIRINGDYSSLQVTDLFGRQVISSEPTPVIETATLSPGIYFLHIRYADGSTVVKKMVKK